MRFDLAVVGGGIFGTCLAHFAAQRSGCAVLLLEQHRVGAGASAASAGFDAVESADPALRELALRSRRLYRAMRDQVPEAAVVPVRTVWLTGPEAAPGFLDNFAGAGGRSQVRPGDAGLLPPFFLPQPRACFFESTDDGYADAGAVCRGIVARLAAANGRFRCIEGAQVAAVEEFPDACQVRLADGRGFEAACVAVAAGPWLGTGPLKTLAAHDTGLRVKKVASLRLAVPPERWPAVVFAEHGAFFLPRPSRGDCLFSFTLDSWDCTPQPAIEMAMALADGERAEGVRVLRALAPRLADAVAGAEVACDLFNRPRRPAFHRSGTAGRVATLAGASGAGYRTAPALAQDVLGALFPAMA